MHWRWEEEYWAYFRWWLHTSGRFGMNVEANMLPSRASFGMSVGRGSRSIKFHISLPFLISLWVSIKGVLPYGERREFAFRVHGWIGWLALWTDPMDGRSIALHFGDWIFGRPKYSERQVEKREVLVPMPEGSYRASAELLESSWTYPRWRTQRVMRVKIDMIDRGIPFEGKGEKSWDCGPDAAHGMTTSARTIAEGVGKLVGSVLHDRVRNGGYSDWSWQKDNIATV